MTHCKPDKVSVVLARVRVKHRDKQIPTVMVIFYYFLIVFPERMFLCLNEQGGNHWSKSVVHSLPDSVLINMEIPWPYVSMHDKGLLLYFIKRSFVKILVLWEYYSTDREYRCVNCMLPYMGMSEVWVMWSAIVHWMTQSLTFICYFHEIPWWSSFHYHNCIYFVLWF